MSHRPPTRADIGKTVEVSSDGENWQALTLEHIGLFAANATVACVHDGRGTSSYWDHCRVPYTCPDPEAELSQAADWMADQGHDEAARVLMQFLAMDPVTQATFLAYRPGDSVTLYHTLLNELVP